MCFSISRHFSFRFFSVSVFLCIFSLHDHDCSILHLHSNAFHILSYISCNKIHKTLVQNKDSKQGEFPSFIYHIIFIVHSLHFLTWRNLGKKYLQLSQDLQIFSLFTITNTVRWIIVEVKWEFLIHTAHTEVSAW